MDIMSLFITLKYYKIMQTDVPQLQQLPFHLNPDKNLISIPNPQKQLAYFILSTEPGRKINYPPYPSQNHLNFHYKNTQGISQQSEGLCVIGFNPKTLQIEKRGQKRSNGTVVQKIIYISKINLVIKYNDPNTPYYQSVLDRRYNFTTLVMPPQELNAQQIQQFLEKIVTQYGQVSKVDVKRNCLIISFEENVTIKENFVVRKFKQNQKGNLLITYWAITTHRTLFTFEPSRLLQIPIDTQINSFIIHSQWLIIATSTQVLFLHLYRPNQHFLTLPQLKVQSIIPIENEKVILFQYKFIYIYQLFTHKNPVLLAKAKTKKIQSYCVAFKKKTALFGGINYSAMMNQPTKQKYIYVVQNFGISNMVNKNFLPDKSLYICKKSQDVPVKNLIYLSDNDLFICTCGQSAYLFHLQSSSLIASVDLASTIMKLYEIQYPINLVNCLVSASNQKNLIRLSFEQYGQIVGAEVTNIDKFGEPVDFYAHKKQIFTTDGDLILQYQNQDKSRVLYSCEDEKQKILNITVLKESLAFLLQKQNIFQAYFMEL